MTTIRLIDARRGLLQQCESLFKDKKVAHQIYWYLCDGLEECDEVKAEPVIRCKDCKRWKDPRDYECPYHTSGDPFIDDDPEGTFFCGKAKRRDE